MVMRIKELIKTDIIFRALISAKGLRKAPLNLVMQKSVVFEVGLTLF